MTGTVYCGIHCRTLKCIPKNFQNRVETVAEIQTFKIQNQNNFKMTF